MKVQSLWFLVEHIGPGLAKHGPRGGEFDWTLLLELAQGGKPSHGLPVGSYEDHVEVWGPLGLRQDLSQNGGGRIGIDLQIVPLEGQGVHVHGLGIWDWGDEEGTFVIEFGREQVYVRATPPGEEHVRYLLVQRPLRGENLTVSGELVCYDIESPRDVAGSEEE